MVSSWQNNKRPDPVYRDSSNPALAGHNPPEPVPCAYCGAPRFTRAYELGDRIIWDPAGPQRCVCPEAVAVYENAEAQRLAVEEVHRKAGQEREMQERVARIIKGSGISARFLQRTFESFEATVSNEKALGICSEYAKNFAEKRPCLENPNPGRNGLFVSGPVGTGKTHLAAAIANYIMNRGTPVICQTMQDLLDGIRGAFNRDARVTSSAVLAVYKDVPLLIIDDLGKEQCTEWAVSTVYNIVNGRYEALMPTIVTTNYNDAQLLRRLTPAHGDSVTAEATIDRLREMCAGVLMSGESWRSRQKS